MKTITGLVQGTESWLAHRREHFNASDAPAMLGISKHKTRSQLLQEIATGIIPAVDSGTQSRFDDGHRFEALARPLAEKIVGDDLSPMVGIEGKLSASFDGITFDESIIWEHKTLNDTLRSALSAGEIPECYRAQMEQQLMISGAEKCLFMASKWDADDVLIEELHCWYESESSMRTKILHGWTQFAIDLKNYQHVEVLPPVTAAPTKDLPALSIQVNGSISLISNLEKFGAQLTKFVAQIDKEPTDDQGFANAEAAINTLQNAQDALEAAEANALAQTSDIDDMRKTVKLYADTARTTRLMLEKMVKARKESIRIEIEQLAKADLESHVAGLNKRLGKPYMPAVLADFAGAIKGKKTVASLHESCNQLLRDKKLEANSIADNIEVNLNSLRELAKDHAFLFSDTSTLVTKANEDLVSLIKVRIAEHAVAEAAKAEAMRVAIQAEEEAKARAKIEAENKAKADAETTALAEQKRKEELAQHELTEAKQKPDGAELSTSAQALLESEGANRFSATHPALAQTEPAAPVQRTASISTIKPNRPTKMQMIEAVAKEFSVSVLTADEWLRGEFEQIAA